MGQVKAQLLHALDHRSRRRCARHHGLDPRRHPNLHRLGCIDQQGLHDGRAAVMRHAMLADRIEDGLRIHTAQAHIDASAGRHRPGKAPAIAMEHGQRPEVDRVLGHVPLQHIADGIGGRAPVVVHHALGVTRGARGVVQGDGIPLIGRQAPGKCRVARRHECLVIGAAQAVHCGTIQGVLHLDHLQRRARSAQGQRLGHGAGELGIDDDGFGLAVIEHEGNGLGIQTRIERVEHCTRHGHAKVGLHHRRRVGQHDGHCVVLANARLYQGAGQLAAPGIGLGPGLAQCAMHDGQTVRVDLGRAGDERQGRHRREIGFVTGQMLVKDAGHQKIPCGKTVLRHGSRTAKQQKTRGKAPKQATCTLQQSRLTPR